MAAGSVWPQGAAKRNHQPCGGSMLSFSTPKTRSQTEKMIFCRPKNHDIHLVEGLFISSKKLFISLKSWLTWSKDYSFGRFDEMSSTKWVSTKWMVIAYRRWQRATEGSREAEPQALRWKDVIIFYAKTRSLFKHTLFSCLNNIHLTQSRINSPKIW